MVIVQLEELCSFGDLLLVVFRLLLIASIEVAFIGRTKYLIENENNPPWMVYLQLCWFLLIFLSMVLMPLAD